MFLSPLISIVIPTRNRGNLLRPCLEGIKQQTFADYEVLILDDGSDQGSRDIINLLLRDYDERFKLHLIHAANTKGSGAAIVRNQGIELANGRYLAFCDDDDFWNRKDYLEVAISSLQNEQADVCFSGIEIHDANGNVVIKKMMPHVESSLQPEQKLKESSMYMINRQQILCYPDYAHLNITICSKDLAKQTGGFWDKSTYAEDVGFFLKLCDQANKILFRPDICAVHNAPDKRMDETISNRMILQDKRLLEISVYQHLLLNCHTESALLYIRKSLANALKMLCEEIENENKAGASAEYARMAWAVLPTLKWGLYALWLTISSVKR